jgi:murein DD-endopeptidase MepM/ murein hydrolase activator NlpD
MADEPLYVRYPAEAAIPARPGAGHRLRILPSSPHQRSLVAIGLAAAICSALLGTVLLPVIDRLTVAPAVPAEPAHIAPPVPAMEKADRLPARRRFDGQRFAEVAERLSSGETRIFTYHRLTLMFRGDRDAKRSQVPTLALVSHRAFDALWVPAVTKVDTDGMPHQAAFAMAPERGRFTARGVPLNVSVAPQSPVRPREIKRLVFMPKDRQGLADILETVGVPDESPDELARALTTDAVAPGDRLELLLEKDPAGGQSRLIMAKLDDEQGGEKVAARDDSNGFVLLSDDSLFKRLASENRPDAPSSSEVATVDLKGNAKRDAAALEGALEQAGMPVGAASDLIRLASSIGVVLNNGDDAPESIDLLFRKSEGRTTELMFIEFHCAGRAHRFYLHRNGGAGAPAEFYDEKGHSIAKTLAHRPVPGGTLGDGFAWRIHPILGVKKFHNGVDFRAPTGSPILAAGDGTVVEISSETGYGKYVRIRHDGGFETTYAHIASAAAGLKVGQRVTQGQVIAHVGSTGYSTGPHLYYELKVNGRYEDPMTASLPAGTNLTGRSLDSLRSQVDHVDSIMSYLDVDKKSAGDEPFSTFDRHGR